MSIMEMSRDGAVMILAIVVVRAIAINRLPKKTFSALWGAALARLLIPYSLPSAFSVYSVVGRWSAPVQAGLRPAAGAVPAPPAIAAAPGGAGAAAGVPAGSSAALYTLVWLAGVLVCAVFFAANYLKCRREFRESLPVDSAFAADWLRAHRLRRAICLRQSDRITAPLTYGVLRPVILLPKHTRWDDESALAHVLTHEYVHIRRFDAVTKLALAAALCVHWFNPAVWVMYALANRDMELSCDEAAIRLLGDRTKAAYAMTLLGMAETRCSLRSLYNSFSKHALEERITAIMKMKKTTRLAATAALALVVGVTTVFATSAQPSDKALNEEEAAIREGAMEQTFVSSAPDFWDSAAHEPTQSELLDEYGAFGISFDASGKMLYQGKPVRWFADFVELEEGALATRYIYRADEGTEYVHTVRSRTDNGDGSYDPFGPLTAIVPWEAGERDDFGFLFSGDQSAAATGSGDSAGITFEERFARYADFGITYVEAEGVSGRGNVYLNGQLVSRFTDIAPNGDAFSFTSAEEGGIYVHTDYDENGNLIAVQEMLPEAIAADEAAQQYSREVCLADFEQTMEQLAPYLAFGLDCEMDFDTGLKMRWEGHPVRRFSDAKTGLFVANSLGDGGLGDSAVDLEAVYDADGNLTGLQIAAE